MFLKHQEEAAKATKKGLFIKYEIKGQGEAQWFLRIRTIRDRSKCTITLVHDSYIDKIATKFKLADNPAVVPYTRLSLLKLEEFQGTASKAQILAYQERIGSILFTAIVVRSDVAFASSYLSRFLTNPRPEHLREADRVIQYLYATRTIGQYGGQNTEAQWSTQ